MFDSGVFSCQRPFKDFLKPEKNPRVKIIVSYEPYGACPNSVGGGTGAAVRSYLRLFPA
jgi:hypothetical protein